MNQTQPAYTKKQEKQVHYGSPVMGALVVETQEGLSKTLQQSSVQVHVLPVLDLYIILQL